MAVGLALAAGGAALAPAAARGDDLVRESIPRRWVDSFLPETLPPLKFPSYYKDLDKARDMAFAGRYKLALITLTKATTGEAWERAHIKATCLAATGKRDEAMKVLADEKVAGHVRNQVLTARIMGELGRADEAAAMLRDTGKKNDKSLYARYYLAELAERAGDMVTARDNLQWINDAYFERWAKAGAEEFDNAEEVTLMARAFDRWYTLNGGYQLTPGLENHILKMFVQAYDIIDTRYWPAHLAAAEYALLRDNQKDGMKELKAALGGNPNSREAHVLLATFSLERFNFDGADKEIAAIRSVDPTSTDADLLDVRNLLQQRRPADALAAVQQVVKRQPRNIEAMGLLAACYALQLREDKVNDTLARVEQLDSNNASAYLEVAEQLGAMRQYPRSAAKYKVAIQRAPWWTAARNGLGLLYTQSGDEKDAREVLEAAKSLDPFNRRTHNYLVLLDDLEKMGTRETDHFVIRYDKDKDPLIPEYFADYLESIYAAVCGNYKTEPPVKTYIEVFPTHDAFSVRTTGNPWIGTVGASTGRVIALVSPRAGSKTLGTYNWATVLRHEFTHTVTLAATDNRIAHWMTEGLAVVEERNPMRWEWVPMLYRAVSKKELFPMDKLTWAFVRPKKPADRQLAYAQSAWVCQYIEEKWGHDVVLKMLAEFRGGKEQDQVFKEQLGKSPAEFTTDFFAWCDKQVEGWGYDAETTKKYNELKTKAEEAKNKDKKEAVRLWEEIVAIRPMDALPHQRLAGLYLDDETKDLDKAVTHLTRLHQVSLKDNRFAKKIARVQVDAGRAKDAERTALEAVYIDPYDIEAHELLAEVCEKSGNKAGAEREKRIIPVIEQLQKQMQRDAMIPGSTVPK